MSFTSVLERGCSMMDNLAAHKVEAIAPLIEAIGATVLYMSHYSPEFNP